MKLFNKEYSKAEILKKVGNLSQLGGTRAYKLTDGKSKGTEAIDVNTGTGFKFTVLPDRGLDISLASYKENNLVFVTGNGEVNSKYYNPQGLEWLQSFFAGLLTTCGLSYFGSPCVDNGVELGIHGRHSNTPAIKVCDLSRWEGDEYIIEISGTVEETVLFGDKITLTRNISTKIGEKSVTIKDIVENVGNRTSPFTILYHINAGFPLLDKTAKLHVNHSDMYSYSDYAKENIKDYNKFTEPQGNANEMNYLHTMVPDEEGYGWTILTNESLGNGIGFYIRQKTDTLNYLNQWKLMADKDYVLGLEPCNTYVKDRKTLREDNVLPMIKPGEKKVMEVKIGICEGQEEINNILKKVKCNDNITI